MRRDGATRRRVGRYSPRERRLSALRGAARRHARLLWWIAAGGPPLLGVSLLIIEPHSPPPLARGYDLSAVLFDLSSILTLLMGLLVVAAAVNRVRGQLDHAFNRPDLPVQTRLKMARTARLRAAWMILVGIMLLTLGAVLAALPEGALVLHPPDAEQVLTIVSPVRPESTLSSFV